MASNNLMDNLRVDIEISPELQNLINNSGELAPLATKLGLRKITREGSKKVKEKVRSLGLVRSGELAKSVRGSTTNKKSYIGTKLWYAHFLEGGTRPHAIKARDGGYLRIPVGGRSLFIRQVTHPGVRAYRFAEGTFETMQTSGEVNSLFAQGVQEAIARFSG